MRLLETLVRPTRLVLLEMMSRRRRATHLRLESLLFKSSTPDMRRKKRKIMLAA